MRIIASPVLSDAATVTASSAASGLPATNLQTLQPGEVCRLDDLADASIDIDLGAAGTVTLVALLAHTASAAGLIRVSAADTQGGLGTGAPYITAWLAARSLAGGPDDRNAFILSLRETGAITRRWWRIELDDATNPAGYVDAGRLYLARPWEAGGAMFGWSQGWLDPGAVELTDGGQLVPWPRTRRRELRFEIRGRTEAEMFAQADELVRTRGATADVLVLRDPPAGGGSLAYRNCLYGLMADLKPIVNENYNVWRVPFRFEELVP